MIFNALAEIFALGAIVPFLAVLTDQSSTPNIPGFVYMYDILKASNLSSGLFLSTLLFLFAAFLSGTIRLINLRLNDRMSALIGTDLSSQIYKHLIYQPYEQYLETSSDKVVATIITHLARTVAGINSSLQMLTSSVVCLGIISTLFFLDVQITLIAIILLSSSYILIGLFSRKKLISNSHLLETSNNALLRIIQTSIGGFREIVLCNYEPTYLSNFRQLDMTSRLALANNQFLSRYPRIALETIGLILMALLGFILASTNSSQESVLSLMAIFALGAQKLLPSIQQIYGGWSQLNGFKADINNVLCSLKINYPEKQHIAPTSFKKQFKIINASYKYPGSNRLALSKINLEINKGEKIGIIGSTGSGKSTLVDLIIGMLEPLSGKCYVDDLLITNSPALHGWRSSIAHVPQSIFLHKGTILDNIAFGLTHDKISMGLAIKSAQKAQILDFIESLPNKFLTEVGENGVKLSGGQRQRIGLARAFYREPNILVLDEATSALDTETEKKIINSLDTCNSQITIIMIAHRLETLKNCDKIICVENGSIIKIGSPTDVIRF